MSVARMWGLALPNLGFPWGFWGYGYGFGSRASGCDVGTVAPHNSIKRNNLSNLASVRTYKKSVRRLKKSNV